MPIMAILGGDVVTAESAAAAAVGGLVEITTDDPPLFTLTVDNAAVLAAGATSARIGVRIQIDLGAGLEVVPDADIGFDVTITESEDGWGDQLQFSLLGPRWSPHRTSLARAKRAVVVSAIYGSLGSEILRRMFTGVVTEANYVTEPAALNITALDAAGAYVTRKLKDYVIQAKSGRTRLDITVEMLTLAGIPIRTLQLPNGDGGRVQKPVAPGDTEVVAFLRDWLAPCGVVIGFIDGGFVAIPFGRTNAATADLFDCDVCPGLQIGLPSTTAATDVVVVAVGVEGADGDDGLAVVSDPPDTVETFDTYAPMHATVIIANDGTHIPVFTDQPAAREMLVSRATTKITRKGSTIIHQDQVEEGWYAVAGARSQINIDGSITPYFSIFEQRYIFPDGSVRADYQEAFRVVRRTIADRTPDADGNIVHTIERRYFYHFLREAIYQVEIGEGGLVDTIIHENVPILDDGSGVIYGREVIGLAGVIFGLTVQQADSETETTITLDTDGSIKAELTVERFYDIGQVRGKGSNGAYGYGIENRQYATLISEQFVGRRTTRKTYRAIDETTYEASVSETTNGGPARTTITRGEGSRPRPEKIEAVTKAHEISARVADGLRQSMNGEIELAINNEYAENADDARRITIVQLQRLSAWPHTFDMPFDGLIHKWQTIYLTRPEHGLNHVRLWVTGVVRNLIGYRQTVTALLIPSEIV